MSAKIKLSGKRGAGKYAIVMKSVIEMLTLITSWANRLRRKLWRMLSTEPTPLSKKSKTRVDMSNMESQSSQGQRTQPQLVSEGVFKDKDGSLIMITALNENEFLFTHENEGSCIIDKEGNQILGKYTEE